MSAKSVLEAKVQVEVEKVYARPVPVSARPPALRPLIVREEVAVREPVVKFPTELEAVMVSTRRAIETKSEVEVALVAKRLVKVEVAVLVAVITPVVI